MPFDNPIYRKVPDEWNLRKKIIAHRKRLYENGRDENPTGYSKDKLRRRAAAQDAK